MVDFPHIWKFFRTSSQNSTLWKVTVPCLSISEMFDSWWRAVVDCDRQSWSTVWDATGHCGRDFGEEEEWTFRSRVSERPLPSRSSRMWNWRERDRDAWELRAYTSWRLFSPLSLASTRLDRHRPESTRTRGTLRVAWKSISHSGSSLWQPQNHLQTSLFFN